MPYDVHVMPSNRATRLRNLTCLYCGSQDQAHNPLTVEHVVGRRFVPPGSLNKNWALIGNACDTCNGKKADLEDEISAITLQPALGDPHTDIALAAIAERKAAGSFSRITKRPIRDSYRRQAIEGTLMSRVTIKAELISPPQLDPTRVYELAWMHLQGFYYLMSYDEAKRQGGFIPGEVGHVAHASRPDWGNEILRSFAALTECWPQQLNCNCADGNFRMIMKREAERAACRSFAIEWNKRHRVIGFFGDLERAQVHLDTFTDLTWARFSQTSRYRRHVALEPNDDTLFAGAVE